MLDAGAYHREDHFSRERSRVFAPAWHFVATAGELPRDGDRAVRVTAMGPVTLQRRDGALRVPGHRVASVGQLVFATREPDAPELASWLDPRTAALASGWFSPRWRLAFAWSLDHPCNWKIPLENVLESYHVDALHTNPLARHPGLFEVFGTRHGATLDAAVHTLTPRYTEYHDVMGARSRAYRAALDLAWPDADVGYVHHHAFPNLVIAHTSIVSFAQVVVPTSPATSHSEIRLFVRRGARGREAVAAALTPALALAARGLLGMVLREDAAVYADVQRGMTASTLRGVLGAREERVHAFQSYIARAVTEAP